MTPMNSETVVDEIPRTLAQFFQEYTFENLDAERDAELVIERTLAWGNREELRWLFARYGRARHGLGAANGNTASRAGNFRFGN